ncbi:MAG: hypothetical protein RL038_1301 [Actinomycetota bacterium]
MRKSSALELAILGLLQDAPLHGYELRKRLTSMIGAFRAISFGALYPALRQLTESGHISQTADAAAAGPALSGKRARITYALTESGQNHLRELLLESGPDTWEDDGFGLRLAFFSSTESVVRRRILEGRRSRLAERRASLKASLTSTRERIDKYTLELQKHGLEGVEREIDWIDDLIASESNNQTNSE